MERKLLNPWTWQKRFGWHHGHVVAGAKKTLFISAQTSVDAKGMTLHEGDMPGQIRVCLDNLEAVLADAGMTPANLVRVTVMTTDMALFIKHARELKRLTDAGSQHTSTIMGVTELAYSGFLVAIEADAVA